MTARWVAATVRARAARSRRVGPSAVRDLARCPDLQDALVRLAAGPYGHDVRPGQDLAGAQHAVSATFVWNLRVLAGWLPREGAGMLRVLAGWAEIANTDTLLASLAGEAPSATYELGSLSTAWPRLATLSTPGALRAELAASAWGDPGTDDIPGIQLGMRLSWAGRVAALAPATRAWATGAVALLVAHELLRGSTATAAIPAVTRVLGPRAAGAGSIEELRRGLPPAAARLIGDAPTLQTLWLAEAAWWSQVEDDARALTRSSRFGPDHVLATVALLAVDAWRVRGALELASRGGTAVEGVDALA